MITFKQFMAETPAPAKATTDFHSFWDEVISEMYASSVSLSVSNIHGSFKDGYMMDVDGERSITLSSGMSREHGIHGKIICPKGGKPKLTLHDGDGEIFDEEIHVFPDDASETGEHLTHQLDDRLFSIEDEDEDGDDLDEAIKSVEQLKGLTQNLGSKTNKYRAMKTPSALKGVQRAEDKIVRTLGKE